MAKNTKKIKETEETEEIEVKTETEETKVVNETEGTEVNEEVNEVVGEIVTEATKVVNETEGTEVKEKPEIQEKPEEPKSPDSSLKPVLKLLSEANWYSQYVFGSHLNKKFESTNDDVKKFYDEFKNGNYLATELDYRVFRTLTNHFQTTKSSI